MISARNLYWVAKNRTARRDGVPLRDLVGAAVANHTDPRQRGPAIAVAAVLEAFGSDLAAHCSFGGLDGSTLTISVDDSRLVGPLRARWLFPLRERLRQAQPGLFVGRIDFQGPPAQIGRQHGARANRPTQP